MSTVTCDCFTSVIASFVSKENGLSMVRIRSREDRARIRSLDRSGACVILRMPGKSSSCMSIRTSFRPMTDIKSRILLTLVFLL